MDQLQELASKCPQEHKILYETLNVEENNFVARYVDVRNLNLSQLSLIYCNLVAG